MEVGNYKFGIKQLTEATPKTIGRFGWALFLTCQTTAGMFVFFGESGPAKYIAVAGFLGLFLANFFGHGNQSNTENVQ